MTTTKSRVADFSTPKSSGILSALHKRGNRWYAVSPRAYGMADGWKLWAALNEPRAADAVSPAGKDSMRFWHRAPQSGVIPGQFSLEDLLAVEPPIFRDAGLRRKAVSPPNPPGSGGGPEQDDTAIEEALVEVLLAPDQLSQRCAYCGAWEYSGDDARHLKVGETRDHVGIYYCGVSESDFI